MAAERNRLAEMMVRESVEYRCVIVFIFLFLSVPLDGRQPVNKVAAQSIANYLPGAYIVGNASAGDCDFLSGGAFR